MREEETRGRGWKGRLETGLEVLGRELGSREPTDWQASSSVLTSTARGEEVAELFSRPISSADEEQRAKGATHHELGVERAAG